MLHSRHKAIRQHLAISSEIVGYEPCKNKGKSTCSLNQLIHVGANSYNALISFDVIEHLDIHDSALIVPELFRISQDIVIVNISCIAAAKNLPCGNNAHTSILPHSTWGMMFWQEALRTNKHFALFCTVSQTQDSFIHNIPLERYHKAFW